MPWSGAVRRRSPSPADAPAALFPILPAASGRPGRSRRAGRPAARSRPASSCRQGAGPRPPPNPPGVRRAARLPMDADGAALRGAAPRLSPRDHPMSDFDGAPAPAGAPVPPFTPLRTRPTRPLRLSFDASRVVRTAASRPVLAQAGQQPGRPLGRGPVGGARPYPTAQPFGPGHPVPATGAARDVLVQPDLRQTARFTVEPGGQSGTELRASHTTIVPHGRGAGTGRVGGRRG